MLDITSDGSYIGYITNSLGVFFDEYLNGEMGLSISAAITFQYG